jgi:hypothetical protein
MVKFFKSIDSIRFISILPNFRLWFAINAQPFIHSTNRRDTVLVALEQRIAAGRRRPSRKPRNAELGPANPSLDRN